MCTLLSQGNFAEWIVNVTTTHTVNNLLEYNLYSSYSYNWICVLFCHSFVGFFSSNSWKNWLRRTTSFTSQPRKHTKPTLELMIPILWSRSIMSITWIFPKSAFHLVLKFLPLLTSVSFYCSISKLNFCVINVKCNLLKFLCYFKFWLLLFFAINHINASCSSNRLSKKMLNSKY